MAVFKNLNTDLTITNKMNPMANVTLATHTVFVQGNLVVGGKSSAITKTELNVTDNIIRVNAGETGAGVTLNTAGLEVDRGTLANVSIVWNEASSEWQLTNDGTTFESIQTGSATAFTSPQVYALVL